jgi:hypothetical protein
MIRADENAGAILWLPGTGEGAAVLSAGKYGPRPALGGNAANGDRLAVLDVDEAGPGLTLGGMGRVQRTSRLY